MKIIAFVTEAPSVRAILKHIGELTGQQTRSPTRGSHAWDNAPLELDPGYDPLTQPEPEYEFDQLVQWKWTMEAPSLLIS